MITEPIRLPEGIRVTISVHIIGDEENVLVLSLKNMPMFVGFAEPISPVSVAAATGVNLSGLVTNPRFMTDAEIRDYYADVAADEEGDFDEVEL